MGKKIAENTVPTKEKHYEFRARLQEEQKLRTNRRKSDKTRDRLKLATIDVLAEIGYRDMKVLDICEKAGVSSGTFYLYFENKPAITHCLLEEFINHLDEGLSHHTTERSPFQALYEVNLEWIKSVRANTGLFRCILQIGDESTELSELINQLNANWYRRITKSVMRRFQKLSDAQGDAILLAVYGLGSMMDEIARKLVISPDPNLLQLVGKTALTDNALAEFLSLIWYRTLYGSTPKDTLQETTSELLAALHLP